MSGSSPSAIASPPVQPAQGFGKKFGASLGMIKIAHTIFALPFAIIGWAWGVAAVKESAAINPELNEVAVRSLPVLAERVGAGPWAW
ncbi:MAG: hypothetical protein HUU29_05145, partial [Planctomycetaceae bacterium]|nr:hypothetical protein [Planctomycetaceae bacterium]